MRVDPTRQGNDGDPLSHEQEACVPQPFGLSTALVPNWYSLFLNRMLNVVSEAQVVA